ncbi:MAG: NFACT family protein [Eubacterium sp.]|nr:NFACT family protein [Eubacterium sp.]MDD7209886.1 NFACT RNA binding domain-containing protein [Lachnospiraceae bacterium]MDY5496962.1 NFACT RNA binding domain-containing protein [Anaerobutyricum sp.]
MAFDGVVIASVVHDMNRLLTGGRIYKIYQPEADELLLVIKNNKETYRLLISAGASLPLIYFTSKTKENPMTAPNFCMLLRKYISNGKILSICQPGMERIVEMTIEHLNEMGDICHKKLIVEIMGKHSNIIFIDEKGMIIDSIKHISNQISSVREVLPGKTYTTPPGKGKIALCDLSVTWMENTLLKKSTSVQKAIYGSISGISPLLANEICYRAGIDGDCAVASLTSDRQTALYGELVRLKNQIEICDFHPNIVYEGKTPKEFSALSLSMFADLESVSFSSISEVLETFYAQKEQVTRIRQKSTDLRRIVQNALERTAKKLDLQTKQLKDTQKKEKYKIYGELLHTYGYDISPRQKELICVNYYDGKEITIPLDPTLSAMENAKKYFDRYGKLKRTYEALSVLIGETKAELLHLESVSNALEIARDENDLMMIREELVECGYLKHHGRNQKKKQKKSKPFHYISSDGFHIYVGKNNFQNDELSFKFANGKDMWFHAKKMAGSHVIVKMETADTLPDRTYEEAARLAAYYSKGRQAPKVEVDYTQRRNLKKPPQAKPGYVIYHTNYSMSIEPDISGIREITE